MRTLTRAAASKRFDVTPLWLNELGKLSKRAGFHAFLISGSRGDWWEPADYQQDFLLHLWAQRHFYRPELGALSTWAERLLVRRRITLFRSGSAVRRYAPSETASTAGSASIDSKTPHRCARLQPELRIEFWNDFNRAIRHLEPDVRRIVRRLAHDRPTEICRQTGISRASLYRIIGQARNALEDGGVTRNYFRRKG
jgi:DNA-directed RNA polymerase specialized sigma24 family protein